LRDACKTRREVYCQSSLLALLTFISPWIDANDGSKFTSEDYRGVDAEASAQWAQSEGPNLIHGSDPHGRPFYYEIGNPSLMFLHPVAPETASTRLPRHFLVPETNFLFFEAPVCSFVATYTPNNLDEGLLAARHGASIPSVPDEPWIDLRDEDQSLVGGIVVPAVVWRDMELPGRYSVVAISRSSSKFDIEEGLSPPPGDDSDLSAVFVQPKDNPLDPGIDNGFDTGKYDANRPWCMYEVMMIQWDGDVAVRLGVGTCHVEVFHQAERVRKRIVLG